MKEFKAKKINNKKKKLKKIRVVIFTFFFFFAYVFMIKYLENNKLKKGVLDEDVNYVNFNVSKLVESKINKVINNPSTLLNNTIKNVKQVEVETKKTSVSDKKNENTIKKEEPVIYIYNTHQTEEYVDYSVYEAAKKLNDMLNKNSYYTSYFEEQSVKVFLEQNDMKYYKSYTASRKYLGEAIIKYPSLTYFFDIHRDSVLKNKSTLSYNDKSYAKVLFVVGTDNPNNQINYENANKLNELIKSKVPNISRGIAKHGGKGYNGVYNQDVSENTFLIEIGGKENTKEEVENTINIIYEAILEYVRGVI
ncbi:MAG: stage II sporulation protein P [Candidatus Aphodocola sp.]